MADSIPLTRGVTERPFEALDLQRAEVDLREGASSAAIFEAHVGRNPVRQNRLNLSRHDPIGVSPHLEIRRPKPQFMTVDPMQS